MKNCVKQNVFIFLFFLLNNIVKSTRVILNIYLFDI